MEGLHFREKQISPTILTNHNKHLNAINQSGLKQKDATAAKARENARHQVTMVCYDWLKHFFARGFLNQS